MYFDALIYEGDILLYSYIVTSNLSLFIPSKTLLTTIFVCILATKVALLKEPKGFVQGIVCDPLGSTFAAVSTDR